MPNKVQQVFISYSHEDADFVNQLASLLVSCDLNVWKDTKDISVGGNIPKAIYEGIKGASHFCCVISKSSVQSAWVEEELSYAKVRQLADQSLQIVPILIDEVEIPDYLKAYRCAHIQNRDLSLDNPEMTMVMRAFGVQLSARITHILTGDLREVMLSGCKALRQEIYRLRDRMGVYDRVREEYKQPPHYDPPNYDDYFRYYDYSSGYGGNEDWGSFFNRMRRYGAQQADDELRESRRKELQRWEQSEWDNLRKIAPRVRGYIAVVRLAGIAAGLKIFMLTDEFQVYRTEEFHLWKDLLLTLIEVDNICEILISNKTMGFDYSWAEAECKVHTWTAELVKAETTLESIMGILKSWSIFDKDIT